MAKQETVTKYLKIFATLFEHRTFSEAMVAVYDKYCIELPDNEFKLACDDCIRQCRFFPSIAEIFEKAEPHMSKLRYEERCKAESEFVREQKRKACMTIEEIISENKLAVCK